MNVYLLTLMLCCLKMYYSTLVFDGEFTGRVIINTTNSEGFIDRFTKRHAGYIFQRRFQIGRHEYFVFEINETQRTRKISKQTEDSDIKNLKLDLEVDFVKQEKRFIRVPKTADTEWSNLWHLNDAVSPSMKVNEAWNAGFTGNGIKIAILDDGLQTDHTDLNSNVDTVNDYDYQSTDDDPTPDVGSSHGTKVAGFIAAEKDNNECTVGIAYESTIIGVRILGTYGLTDSQEAQALNHHLNGGVDIYSNSWGPTDGYGFSRPDTLSESALQDGITNGRGGKGVIYTWAAGNGETSDNCNGDGYVNSIYTIGVTSVEEGQNAWYSEVCAAALVATYGGSSNNRYLTSTTTSSGCTSDGLQGTSFSTPIASGIIALALQANSALTWRDIQHMLVLTSTRNGFTDSYSSWKTNGGGKEYSQVLGFGLMDAEAMVTQAASWTKVPTQQTCTTSTFTGTGSTSGSSYTTDIRSISTSDCSSIDYLEHVTIDISFSYTRYRGVTEFYLVSPSGTESHLMHYRYDDAIAFSSAGSLSWTFMSVHFWRETPIGQWTLKSKSYGGLSVVTVGTWSITFYGTSTDPLPNIDQCISTPCQNNGTCTNNVYSYSCQCPDDYSGTNCQTISTDDDGTSSTIVVAAVGGTIGAIVVGVIVVAGIKSISAGATVGTAGGAVA
ncbi:proprotein convertase subtilisin/kexin type 6-like [Mytilus californianus]|uniref:proprotein convertase subtilisin/kexin type 6-like n=1 Tax=Mytilus californianus TaxID=6549 RepID=UPI00224682C3|nr:proprotein convertase subtilisin/kexin type 6-like [Mytilus californianus]